MLRELGADHGIPEAILKSRKVRRALKIMTNSLICVLYAFQYCGILIISYSNFMHHLPL